MLLNKIFDCDVVRNCKDNGVVWQFIGLTAVGVSGFLVFAIKWKKKQHLKKLALRAKNAETIAIVKKLDELLQDKDVDEQESVLKMSPVDLVDATKNDVITPLAAVKAYENKACSVTMEINCVTGIIKNAEQLASMLEADSSYPMLLYGLPVSVKESMNIKGMDSTMGLPFFIGHPAPDDCVLVKVLKHCGAIPFVKTNLPQLMQCFGGSNPIFGETGNPYNASFTPGGSTAGEAALIAAGGSPLGFGTDIAGSIRNPAHFCGIAGLKPTKNRISTVGMRGSLPGQTLVAATVGPMARDVDTLILAMRALSCPLMFDLDPIVPPLPFNEETLLSKKRLRIGYYITDGFNKPVPAVARAVAETKAALENAGHALIQFEVPRIKDAIRILISALYADGAKINLDYFRFAEVDKRIKHNYCKWKCPSFIRSIVSFALGLQSSRIGEDFALHGGGDRSVTRLWKLQVEASEYKREFLNLWNNKYGGLDAIICPPFPVAAGPQGSIVEDMTKMMNYTALYNLLDFPAGVVPVTKVNEQDIRKLENYQGHYGDQWDKEIREVSKLSLGMPVGVQCVCLPWQEEECLRIMKEIESLLAFQ